MQKYVLVCLVLTLTTGARLDFDSDDCRIFLGKFDSIKDSDGTDTGVSKIAFSGDASFIGTTADVKVNLRYSDIDYFNDPKLKGLVIQDGKTPETTCLDMKLFTYATNYFSQRFEVTDLTITSSENFTKQWRFYSFIIKGTELATRMFETKNYNYLIYEGYYSIAYYAAETDKLFFIFDFWLTVTLNRETGAAVDTTFNYFDTAQQLTGPIDEYSKPDTLVQWCTDFTCTEFAQPDLHFKDQFILFFKINIKGLSNYYLTECEVWYTGIGLNKKATIKQLDNKTPGQVKLLLNAEIVWRAVTIKVSAVLSTNPTGNRMLIEQTTQDTVTGKTEEITCIKPEDSDICATCEQECDMFGFAGNGCDVCSLDYILSAFLFGLFLFSF